MPLPVPGRIADALRHATVAVSSSEGHVQGGGSGLVLGEETVITNAHVARSQQLSVESWEGRSVPATLVRVDGARDLALLSTKGLRGESAILGDSREVRPGTPVFAIGNPLGFTGALSAGVVHSTGVADAGMNRSRIAAHRWICADLRLAPGNSGGPLADYRGHVIGINTMVISGGLALAIPSRAVEAFLARREPRQRIGVTLRPVRRNRNGLGLLILEIESGSAAERASLLPGDIIIGVDGDSVQHADDLQNSIETTTSGLVRLKFTRGGDTRAREVAVQIANERVTTAA
ncbi:MAG: serine protease [Acidobacteriaceae bacterium]|nr:serine protease [Acidobacteriaceae bacterium]